MKKRSMLNSPAGSSTTTSPSSSASESGPTSRKVSEDEAYVPGILTRHENLYCCLICIEPFTKPKLLQCHHVFCEACLVSYSKTYGEPFEEDKLMFCPVCSKMTELADGGIAGLKCESNIDMAAVAQRKVSVITDYAVQRCDLCIYKNIFEEAEYYCNKCNMNFCAPCKSKHEKQQLFKPHACIHICNKEVMSVYCDKHVKQICTYFCMDCNHPTCVVCVILNHSEHSCSRMSDALAIKRENIKTMLNTLGPAVYRLENNLEKVSLMYTRPDVQSENGDEKIPNRVQEIGTRPKRRISRDETANTEQVKVSREEQVRRNTLTKRDTKNLRRIFAGGRKKLAECRQDSTEKRKISSEKNSGEHRKSSSELSGSFDDPYGPPEWTDSGDEKKTKRGKKGIIKMLQMGSKDSSDEIFKLTAFKSMSLTSTPKKRPESRNLPIEEIDCVNTGDISDCALPEMSEETLIKITDKTQKVSHLRKLFTLTSKVLEMSQSKKLLIVYEDILSRIQRVIGIELPVLAKAVDKTLKEEQEKVKTFSQEQHGHLSLHEGAVKSKSAPLKSSAPTENFVSEDAISVQSQAMLYKPKMIWKVENHGLDTYDLSTPCGMVFLPDGNLVVAEYDNANEKGNRLQMFSPNGRTLACFEQGKIKPLGVASNQTGNIFVTDCNDKRVKIYSSSGIFIGDFGKGQFGWPHGIACNKRGQVIVSDAFCDTISIFSSDGKRLKHFGSSGTKQTQFRNPYHIAVDSANNIIVADSGNNCVKVFDSNGKFMHVTSMRAAPNISGSPDTGKSIKSKKYLKRPKGVAVDKKDNLLVADSHSRIAIFENSKRFIRNLLTEDDSIKCPEAVAASSNGLLAISEWNPHNMFSVKVFAMYE